MNPFKWWKNRKLAKKRKMPRLGVRPESLEGRLRSSLADATTEYLEQSSLEGIMYATRVESVGPLRHIYIVLMVALFVWGLCVLANFSHTYQRLPALQDEQIAYLMVQLVQTASPFPVHFPAVAICSNSIISKKRLVAYAAYLKEISSNETYDEAKIQQNLAKFAALVTLRSADVEMINFMQFLLNLKPDFNITDLMYTLSPKCSSMLSWCKWRGRQLPCEQLFATRLTPLGFCCLFNSRFHPEDLDSPPKVLELTGQNYGLSVGVHQNSDDFAVLRQPATQGLAVLLFDGGDYPLIEGGAVTTYNVGANASVFFQLTAHAQYVTDNLKNFKAEKRGCHVRSPDSPIASKRSYSWCLAECRRRSTAAICNCQPFWYRPLVYETVCTTEHLYCLNKHREKLIYYYPRNAKDESLDVELQNSLDCAGCLPDCARVLHSAKVFHPSYYYPKKLYTNGYARGVSLVNKTLLRFYYDSMSHQVYRVDLNYFWYEMFAIISCQSLFLVGASLISASELVFHFTVRWAHHFVRRTREEVARRRRLAFH